MIKGQEDQEMTRGLGLLSHQEVEMVIPKWWIMIKMIGAFTNCLESFIRKFESPNSRTQSYKDITLNARDVWVKKGTHA